MATQNYSALIAAWNSTTQPPTGVLGTGLVSSMTTQQKIVAINGWSVTGAIPAAISLSGVQLLNCINYAEFAVLSTTAQLNLLALCAVPGALLGGSSNTALIVDGMFLAQFNHTGATITNLTNLAQAQVQSWWSSLGGLSSPVGLPDLQAAGGLT